MTISIQDQGISFGNTSAAPQLFPITCTVAANSLLLSLAPTTLTFRNPSLSSGTPVTVICPTLSITVPSGATLGTTSNVSARLDISVAYNGGVPVLCVSNSSGVIISESGFVSPTAITSGATSGSTIYSASTVSANSPVRVIGYIDIAESVAGVWAAPASLVQGSGDSDGIPYMPFGAGAVAGTVQSKLRESVSVKDFGAKGDGVTDDTAAIILANAAAVAAGVVLYFPAGTYKCKALTLNDIYVDGVILGYGSVKADAVLLSGSVQGPDRKIFSWSATDPTNLPGTTYPFIFSTTSTWGGSVNVKWFGATGDNVTDDSMFLNACAAAMSFAQVNGTPYATKRGPVEMMFPRGNYRIGKDSTVNITTGTVMSGQSSGSNPLSTLIKDDVTYGQGTADMIWVVSDNETYTASASQIVVNRLSFIWRPSIDFNSSTAQLDTSFFDFKSLCIDAKFHDCWFLGAPQKGSIFAWGNKYQSAGTGISKVSTGADSDGLNVIIHTYNTFFDVTYGSICTIFDKGYGATTLNSCFTYQTYLGLVRNFSTYSAARFAFTTNSCKHYALGANSASPVQYDPTNKVTTVTTGQTLYRRTDFVLNNAYITNVLNTGVAFFFNQSLNDCSMTLNSCIIDSTDATTSYYFPIFDLTSYSNSLFIRGTQFKGNMTPNPGVFGYNKSLITKYQGAGALNGLTSALVVTGCDINIGPSTTYFIYKFNTQSQIADTEVFGNYFNFTDTAISFSPAGATSYRIVNNTYSTASNVIQTDWQYPTFINGWTDFDVNNRVQYRVNAIGNVEIRGNMKSGTLNAIAFTLPVGFRPATSKLIEGISKAGATNTSAYGLWAINHLGQFYPILSSDASTANFYLDNISYQAVQ